MPIGNRKASSKKQNKLLINLLLAAALSVLCYIQWSHSVSTNPAQALKKAIGLLDSRALGDVESLLEITHEEPLLRGWSDFYLGKYFELKGEIDTAARHYQLVSPTSAASLDARLGLVSLQEFLTNSAPADAHLEHIATYLADLERDIRAHRRIDLLYRLMLVSARQEDSSGNAERAIALYNTIRTECQDKEITATARQETERLRAAHKELAIDDAVPAVTTEVQLLLREEDPAAALKLIESAKEHASPQSSAFYQLKLVEADVLLALNRKLEAEQTLREVSSDDEIGLGDIALEQLIKKYWNEDNQHQALEMVTKFQERFAASPKADDVRYMEARLLEELGQVADAHHDYEKLATSARRPTVKVQALRRTAWLYFTFNDFESAAKFFADTRVAAANNLALPEIQSSPNDTKDTEEELAHATFWEAASRLKTTAGDAGRRTELEKTASSLFSELATKYPDTFYAQMAREQLATLDSSNRDNSSSFFAEGAAFTPENLNACTKPVPEDLDRVLTLLSAEDLADLAKHEIDWAFAEDSPGILGAIATRAENFSLIATRSKLYLDHAHVEDAVSLALYGIRQMRSATISKPCLSILYRLAYPMPRIEIFREQAEKQTMDPALLLAIAHTESHFNPLAKSNKGALGLMQLMPQTAKQEGLESPDKLFDPATNVTIGAKHLRGLLETYGGDSIYAIAAYNAGTGAVNRWKSRNPDVEPVTWIELIGYPETKNYVKKVLLARDLYREELKK